MTEQRKLSYCSLVRQANIEDFEDLIGFQLKINLSSNILPLKDKTRFHDVFENLRKNLLVANAESQKKSNWRSYGSRININGVDQIAYVLEKIRKRQFDRRILLVDYNPILEDNASQCLIQFYMDPDNKLSCKTYQSLGSFSGLLNGDMARPVLLTYMLCHICDLIPGDHVHTFGRVIMDVSRYQTLLHQSFPTISISGQCQNLEDFTEENFSIKENVTPFTDDGLTGVDYCYIRLYQHEEQQYLQYVRDIIDHGWTLSDRTGVGTRSIFGGQMRFSLKDKRLPLLTTKRVFVRGVIEELLWFLKGSTNSNDLAVKKIHFWDANGSKEFLENIGLGHREQGDLGPVYGFQWRHFGAKYVDVHADYTGKGVDQIRRLINGIKENPTADNHILMAWNPNDLPLMALPPCHCMAQFFVVNNKLSCKMYQRAGDMGLGVPFNIASYSILTHMIAHITGYETGNFIYTLGDGHVYLNHIEALDVALSRDPREFPKLKFKRQISNIEDFKYEDFEIVNYNPHPRIVLEMAV